MTFVLLRRPARQLAVCFAIVAVSFACGQAAAHDVYRIGRDAYIYGYPLVTMEMTRRVMTNVAEPNLQGAPMGQFRNAREYPNASFRAVTAPNADTLYSTAWLDLTQGAYVLSLPEEDGRYYLMPMLSGWTNVFVSPGTRTTGTGPQKYAITGPGWQGDLPDSVKQIEAPTNMVWLLGRTYCTGTPEDYSAVHALQSQYDLVPLNAYGKPYTPPKGKVDPAIDMRTAVRDQVHRLTAEEYFGLLARLMQDNPPAAADAPIVEQMAKIGLVPGEEFDLSKLSAADVEAIRGVPPVTVEDIGRHAMQLGRRVNGWSITDGTGEYGADYLRRAAVTMIGLGANLPQDAVYPVARTDVDGQPLDGAHNYVIHVDKDQYPPVRAFWSLTMYDDQMFFVDNRLDRYTLSSRDKFVANDNGSVDLCIQHESPGGEKEANWLPAPSGPFVLMLRLYWPRETDPSILDGTWQPPAVKKAS